MSANTDFQQNGFAFFPKILSSIEVDHYSKLIDEMTAERGENRWAEADGIGKNEKLWPIIYNKNILGALNELGSVSPKYLHHSDVHVNYDSIGWHRDTARSALNVKTKSNLGSLRVAIYLQSKKTTDFKMGVIPKSHRNEPILNFCEYKTWGPYTRFSKELPRTYLFNKPQWFDIDAGDCLIFDTRILHTGTRPSGPKTSLYLVYGENDNELCDIHYDYIHNQRKDLGYETLDPKLEKILSKENLLHERLCK